MAKHTPSQQKSVVRSTRPIMFICQHCGKEVTEDRYPSHTPLYCAACQPEVVKAQTRVRVAAHRQRKAALPAPLPPATFPEGKRGYHLSVFLPRRLAIDALTGEGCLQAVKSSDDDEVFTIAAYRREQEIGRGQYRKHGAPGRLETVETLLASGDLVGFIEAALARRAEERQKQLQAERAERLIQLACSCEQSIGYDERDHCFSLPDGQAVTVCPTCGKPLDLAQITQDRQQRIASLQDELKQQQGALRQIQLIGHTHGNS